MSHPICIIDDDDDIREILCYALELEGIETLAFSSAILAKEHLESLSSSDWPCLIIVDFMMPEMDGLSFITLLRHEYSDTLGKIPIALNTARIPEPTDIVYEDVLYLAKPLDLEALLKTARKYYQSDDFGKHLPGL